MEELSEKLKYSNLRLCTPRETYHHFVSSSFKNSNPNIQLPYSMASNTKKSEYSFKNSGRSSLISKMYLKTEESHKPSAKETKHNKIKKTIEAIYPKKNSKKQKKSHSIYEAAYTNYPLYSHNFENSSSKKSMHKLETSTMALKKKPKSKIAKKKNAPKKLSSRQVGYLTNNRLERPSKRAKSKLKLSKKGNMTSKGRKPTIDIPNFGTQQYRIDEKVSRPLVSGKHKKDSSSSNILSFFRERSLAAANSQYPSGSEFVSIMKPHRQAQKLKKGKSKSRTKFEISLKIP